MTFQPKVFYIQDISNTQLAVITFTEDHDYVIGEIISLRVSKIYGMIQANNLSCKVIGITSNTVTTNLDTLGFFPFVYTSDIVQYPALAVPSASGILPDPTDPYKPDGPFARTIITDAFDNYPTGQRDVIPPPNPFEIT